MMVVILVSIGSFTIASNPKEQWYSEVWVNLTTGEPIPDSRASPRPPNSYLSDSPSPRSGLLDENREPFGTIETVCIMIFTLEYLLRLFASPQGPGVCSYLTNAANIIDLVSVLPWYIEKASAGGGLAVLSVLRIIRLTRITRIFKMSKNFQGLMVLFTTLKKSAAALLMLFAFMAIFSILFATLIYTFEAGTFDGHRMQYVREDGSRSPFESIPDSLWWTIVTMTTVGYGDQYPVTTAGKIIAVVTMFCGLVVLSLPITIIGANFDMEYRLVKKQKQEEQERKRKERAAAITRKLGSALALSTPKKSAADAGTPGAGGVDPSPRGGDGKPGTEDPIKFIQSLIHEEHCKLTEEV